MQTKEIIVTNNAPGPTGPFSQAVKEGVFVFVSGQLGTDLSSGEIVEGGIEAETKQVVKNLRAILEAAGSSLAEVVKTTVYLTDWNNFAKMNEVYSKFFAKDFPARATVEVGALARGAKVEIDAIATSKQRSV